MHTSTTKRQFGENRRYTGVSISESKQVADTCPQGDELDVGAATASSPGPPFLVTAAAGWTPRPLPPPALALPYSSSTSSKSSIVMRALDGVVAVALAEFLPFWRISCTNGSGALDQAQQLGVSPRGAAADARRRTRVWWCPCHSPSWSSNAAVFSSCFCHAQRTAVLPPHHLRPIGGNAYF